MNEFQVKLEGRWTTMPSYISGKTRDGPMRNVLILEDEDEEFTNELKKAISHEDMKYANDYNKDEIGIEDPYLNMELGMRHKNEEGLHHARVKHREIYNEGIPIGTPNKNPLLEHQKYEVEFLDGRIDILTANIIADNLLAQVDDNGHLHL